MVALGTFDGLHLGHRAVLAQAKRTADRLQRPFGVMTFEPHPRQFFRPEVGPLSIYPLSTRLRLLEAAGVDIIYLLRFGAGLACLSAREFIDDILCARLAVSQVVTGDNFAFGRERGGDASLLAEYGAACGFGASLVAGVAGPDGQPCSSSRIRSLLAAGDIDAASGLLGRPYTITGRVRQGERRGHTLGFPTANIAVSGIFLPALGVYSARLRLPDGTMLPAVANLGVRPTVGTDAPLLEVHCLDWQGNLYGAKVEVQLQEYLRPERRFETLAALADQIARDCALARQTAATHEQRHAR